MVIAAHAEWSYLQVRQWAWDQGITNDTSGVVVGTDTGIESGWQSTWGVKPTRAQVEAIDWQDAKVAIAARKSAQQAADTTSSVNAFVNLRTRLHAADVSFQNIETKDDLLGALPRIISTIQAKIDAKDALIAAELDKDTTAGFKQAITLMQQRNQLTDGYNTIQSWALALVIRKGGGR